jgi:broad specificity phosphatase PhoE
MTTRIVLVRHGRTAFNADLRFMGQLDIPLDEVGRGQALSVASRLQSERPSVIYTSDLSRARDTALAIQSAIPTHPDLRTDPRLTEGHFGEWQGQTLPVLKTRDPEFVTAWQADPLRVIPPGSESLPDFAARVDAAYRDICRLHADQDVMVVAHGGSLQLMIVIALELPIENYRKFWVSNASVSRLRIDEWGTTVDLLNDVSHLAAGA